MSLSKVSCFLVALGVSSVCLAGVVSPEVEALIRQSPNLPIDVVCFIESPPAFAVAMDVKGEYSSRLRHFGGEVKNLARTAQVRPLTVMEDAQRRQNLETIDALLNERGARIAEALENSAAANIATVSNAIEAYGGIASGPSAVLASVRGLVPAGRIHELAKHPNVTYIDVHFVGAPLLDNQTQSLGLENAGGFWNNGIDGGPFDVGLIDTGVQRNHPAFAGFNWEGVITDPDGHGTGVTGMMVSTNASYRGMAFGLHTVCAADANLGMREATDWLLTQTNQRPEAINVSWGSTAPDTEDYRPIEAWYDSAADIFDITFGQAAGNEGASGYGSLGWPGKAYNTIGVANVYDHDTVTRSDDDIRDSSSRGPTPLGRKKPDIAAPGHDTWSTTRTLGFGNLGGTSSAAPKVTGAAVLLRDFGLTSALEDKAVLINSADAWSDNNTLDPADDGPALGSHWSRAYGWGYLDLLAAYQQAPNVITDSFSRPIFVGGRRIAYYSGTRPTGFKATLVWNRHVGPYSFNYPTEYDTLTNFNLGLYSGTTGAGISQSISTRDNVEQVGSLSNGASVLKVHTTGTWDVDISTEVIALAVPATFTRKTPPDLDVTINVADFAVVGSEIAVSGTVTNNGELPAYNVLASTNAVVVGGNNPAQLGTITPGQTKPVNWLVQVDQSSGVQTIRIDADSDCYGESFSGFISEDVTILAFTTNPTSYTRIRGTHTGGTLASVTSSNNQYLTHTPGIVFSVGQSPVELVFTGTAPMAAPVQFFARVEAGATSPAILQTIEVYNYATPGWVEISSANLATTDGTRILAPPGTLSDYVQPGTRKIEMRVRARAVAPMFSFPWTHRIDQIGWHIDD
ncbi:MAG: S8 family serine peptidase [Armatimonadota bacterium]|nr:S8 family serine peptidase [Armatimonadota bacterium]